jgi:hypothetical protein
MGSVDEWRKSWDFPVFLRTFSPFDESIVIVHIDLIITPLFEVSFNKQTPLVQGVSPRPFTNDNKKP